MGGGILLAGSVVFGLTGTSAASPKRSTGGAAAARGGAIAPPFLRLAVLSTFTFSCTMLSGTSSSSASVLGSGIGPSMTHLLLSYFVLIKFSIFDSFGTWPGASFASQYLFARALPHFMIDAICSSVQVSRSTDLTREMCTPILRWMPEQRMQTKTPRFQDAHRGCLLRLQSAHDLFDSSFTSCLRMAAWSFGGGRRDIVSVSCAVAAGFKVPRNDSRWRPIVKLRSMSSSCCS